MSIGASGWSPRAEKADTAERLADEMKARSIFLALLERAAFAF
jgi:hypothetical protein